MPDRGPKAFLWILCFCLIFSWPAYANTSNFSSKSKEKEKPLPPPIATLTLGESFVFDVFWMGVHVGTGSLEVKEKVTVLGREAYHVVAIARTNEFLSKIYPIVDEAHTYMEADSLYSLEFRKNLSEGSYRADEKVTYDYEKKKAYYESLLNGTKSQMDITSKVHDFLSAFYWFRLQVTQVGEKHHTVLHNKGKNYDLEIDVQRREKKELKGGVVIDTIVVEPKTRLKDVLYRRGRAWVYFTADEKRMPVWVTISTPFGPVVGVLRRSD